MVKLIVEGTTDTSNGDLRKGFNKLLSKKLSGKMPRIIMGEGKTQAIDKFRNCEDCFLLCDLDGPEAKREKDISDYQLEDSQHRVYYMTQEMEAWFISQPDILDKFYNNDLSAKIPKKPASTIENPDEKLEDWTMGSRKGEYHKVKHGTILLEMLDADQLMEDFPDFKRLVNTLWF